MKIHLMGKTNLNLIRKRKVVTLTLVIKTHSQLITWTMILMMQIWSPTMLFQSQIATRWDRKSLFFQIHSLNHRSHIHDVTVKCILNGMFHLLLNIKLDIRIYISTLAMGPHFLRHSPELLRTSQCSIRPWTLNLRPWIPIKRGF